MTVAVPSQAEVDREIADLQGFIKQVPEHGAFGNDHEAIRAQIEVLKGNVTTDEIGLQFEADNVFREGHIADNWWRGLDDIQPSTNWRKLI